VEVEKLDEERFAKLPVPYSGEEVTTLGHAVGSYMQWPAKYIHVVVEKVDMLKLTNKFVITNAFKFIRVRRVLTYSKYFNCYICRI